MLCNSLIQAHFDYTCIFLVPFRYPGSKEKGTLLTMNLYVFVKNYCILLFIIVFFVIFPSVFSLYLLKALLHEVQDDVPDKLIEFLELKNYGDGSLDGYVDKYFHRFSSSKKHW